MSKEKKSLNPKQFVQKIIRFLTEPVKSSAEAESRKKELIPYALVSLGAAIVLMILGMNIESIAIIFNILAFVCMFFVFIFGWCLFKAISLKKKFADLECSNCKTVIKYTPDFPIEVTSKSFSLSVDKTSNAKAGVDVRVSGIETATVSIVCKCQECGTEKKLVKIFTTIHCFMENKGISALTVDLLAEEMKKKIQAAYDNGFENCPSDIRMKKKTTGERAMIDYFSEDGTAGKTPWGTVTKTKK